jgi:hypothetical protein
MPERGRAKLFVASGDGTADFGGMDSIGHLLLGAAVYWTGTTARKGYHLLCISCSRTFLRIKA